MKPLISELRTAVLGTLVLALLTCGVYPAVVWAVARLGFRERAAGSLVIDSGGQVRGSTLLGQRFRGAGYFHGRPSAAGSDGYDATASGGSNLGPTSRRLRDLLATRIAEYRAENGLEPGVPIPADAVTASGSGLDPHISPANAELQVRRVATARGLGVDEVRNLVTRHVEAPDLLCLGEARVHVLRLNLALDQLR